MMMAIFLLMLRESSREVDQEITLNNGANTYTGNSFCLLQRNVSAPLREDPFTSMQRNENGIPFNC